MTKIDCFHLGIYGANCYVLRAEDSKTCVVVDPGGTGIVPRLQMLKLTPEAVLLTHGHFDHIGGVSELREAFPDCPVYLHPGDLTLPEALTNGGPIPYTHTMEEGDVFHYAGLEIRVLSTPGHSEGSVCFLLPDVLLTGDTLFAASCGRTDLTGGSTVSMHESLRRLYKLDFHGPVYCGHGIATELDREREYNPYMKRAVAE